MGEHRAWARGERGQPVTVGPAREPQWEARGPARGFGRSCGSRWRRAEVEPGTAVAPIYKWDVGEGKGEQELALSVGAGCPAFPCCPRISDNVSSVGDKLRVWDAVGLS